MRQPWAVASGAGSRWLGRRPTLVAALGGAPSGVMETVLPRERSTRRRRRPAEERRSADWLKRSNAGECRGGWSWAVPRPERGPCQRAVTADTSVPRVAASEGAASGSKTAAPDGNCSVSGLGVVRRATKWLGSPRRRAEAESFRSPAIYSAAAGRCGLSACGPRVTAHRRSQEGSAMLLVDEKGKGRASSLPASPVGASSAQRARR
jgi:hypothetical protein